MPCSARTGRLRWVILFNESDEHDGSSCCCSSDEGNESALGRVREEAGGYKAQGAGGGARMLHAAHRRDAGHDEEEDGRVHGDVEPSAAHLRRTQAG